MYVMTKEKQENDVVKDICIVSPRFDIDEVRRVKALIRFKLKSMVTKNVEEGMELHDIHTMMKFGRCTNIGLIGNALHCMRIRVPGKVRDSIYELYPIYNEGNIDLTIGKAYTIDKNHVF